MLKSLALNLILSADGKCKHKKWNVKHDKEERSMCLKGDGGDLLT